jgi:hypothetical protein
MRIRLIAACLALSVAAVLSASSQEIATENKNTLAVFDDRIEATRLPASAQLPTFEFFGKRTTLRGLTLQSASGAAVYRSTEQVLDARWQDGHEYLLSRSQLRILTPGAGKPVVVRLPATSEQGRLLITRPAFVAVAFKNGNAGVIAILDSKRLRIVDTEEHFSAAAADRYGNFIIACGDEVFALSHAGHHVPIVRLKGEEVTDLVVLNDNSLLIATTRGLLKYGTNRRFYPLLRSSGTLLSKSGGFAWNDSVANAIYSLRGLELPGNPQSDREYITRKLREARVYARLGKPDLAYKKVRQVQLLTPEDPAISGLADTLRRGLKQDQQ